MPQRPEGILSLGKDEVGGSNPPSSSKKSCFLSKTGFFLYFLADLICGSGCGTALTHTLTHTRKCAERAKEERTDISVRSSFLSLRAHPCLFRSSKTQCALFPLRQQGHQVRAAHGPHRQGAADEVAQQEGQHRQPLHRAAGQEQQSPAAQDAAGKAQQRLLQKE